MGMIGFSKKDGASQICSQHQHSTKMALRKERIMETALCCAKLLYIACRPLKSVKGASCSQDDERMRVCLNTSLLHQANRVIVRI